ncbi:MAG: antioxidant, AhpC/TSA family [Candidatus Eremiobacteraeota bacterium]|jgi:thioredoxin-dependent peroxiredoxin|nr:antioxidant, AhpC/TSA family [Candidatus Eremiobacteraeota bacterium]
MAAAVGVFGTGPVSAELAHGATAPPTQLARGTMAPPFSLQAALGGDVETVDLKAALAKGPVVLYFFPKSFTQGCTVEAHLFSEHIAEYRKLGATVIGVSGDDIETQKKFSTQECRAAFLVASDPGLKIAKEYDAQLTDSYANRTSYVIAQDGTIAYAYTSLDPAKHVENTLTAIRALVKP